MSPLKSTIVRSNVKDPAEPPPPPRPAGTAVTRTFGALERLSPALGSAVAERLWFRLPAVPPAERRARHTPPGGDPFELTLPGGRVVRGMTYGARGLPTAHLVHGWGGWWQQLGMLVAPLRDAGFRVVVHDAPSHGGSAPGLHGQRSTTLVELADAHDAVVVHSGRADLVVAHSAGTMAVLWAREQGTVAGAYALLASATSAEERLDWFQKVLGVGPRTRATLARRVERRIGLPLADWDVRAMVARREVQGLTHVPLLAVHDLDDDETPARGSVALADAWPGSDLVLTRGLGHRRILRDPEVGEKVAAFGAATLARP